MFSFQDCPRRLLSLISETTEGDFIGIRYHMFMSHAYDHRNVKVAFGG